MTLYQLASGILLLFLSVTLGTATVLGVLALFPSHPFHAVALWAAGMVGIWGWAPLVYGR